MSNRDTINTNNNTISGHNTRLSSLLTKINSLPEAGSGGGEDLTTELTQQTTLLSDQTTSIADIKTALEGKGAISPKKTMNITENGTYDVTNYAKANVNINIHEIEDLLLRRRYGEYVPNYVNNRITEIGDSAFAGDYFETITCENAKTLGFYACQDCYQLATVNFPLVKRIMKDTFYQCGKLTEVNIPNMEYIGYSAFSLCKSLEKLVIRQSSVVCQLAGTDAFNSTPIASGTGYIYVPDTLVNSYKTATNWKTYANQIKPLSELEE